jgi:threonine dehydratase
VSPAKLAKMKAWGADTRIVGDAWDDANAAALAFARQTGAAYFHPFADPLVVAGQGTLGLEIIEEMPDIDTILVAIGGGGLIAGLGTAFRALRPDIRVIGVEPIGSPTMSTSSH